VAEREAKNTDSIILYLEGIFYKAYDRSAYLFVKNVKPYLVKKYYYKKLKRTICSLGFPAHTLEGIVERGQYQIVQDEKMVILRGAFSPYDPQDYEEWEAAVPITQVRASRRKSHESVLPPPPTPDMIPHPERRQVIPLGVEPPIPSHTAEEDVCDKLRHFSIETATPIECILFLTELKKMLNQDNPQK
jgi:hypothetical protein